MPSFMKAISYHRYASPPALQLETVPRPAIKPDEILVAVKAAALNQMDIKIASGDFRLLTGRKFPKRLGSDFSGEVVAVGQKVKEISVGSAVFGYAVALRGDRGSFAEYFAVKAD